MQLHLSNTIGVHDLHVAIQVSCRSGTNTTLHCILSCHTLYITAMLTTLCILIHVVHCDLSLQAGHAKQESLTQQLTDYLMGDSDGVPKVC